jgi:tetratricopeptide (TPR) repeat protein
MGAWKVGNMRGYGFAILLTAPLIAERAPTASVLQDPGFAHFYNLEYDQALADFRAAAAASGSADAFNHVAQAIVFRAMFRAGALDTGMVADTQAFLHMPKIPLDPADDAEFMQALNRAMSIAQAQLDRNPNDTAALYSLGVSHGLLGNYHLVVQKKYVDALHEATAARKLHNRATAIDPDFIDARLTQGLNDYIVGSLPLAWKMLGFLGGFHGDRLRGIKTLELVAERGSWNRVDAKVMLAAIYRREKHPERSVTILDDLIPRMPRNYLLRLELAEMYGDLGDARAGDVLAEVEQMRAQHAPGYDAIPERQIAAVREHIAAQTQARR